MKRAKRKPPTREEKLEALRDPTNAHWMFSVGPPAVTTRGWTADDWLTYIGDNWYERQA